VGPYTLGLDREADDFFAFIADVSGANNGERHPLQVMYGVGGERSLEESELTCPAYDYARPVRIGNGAFNQMQHDIWGTMLDSVYLHAKSREQVPENLWPVLKEQVERAIKHWRTRPRHLGGPRRTSISSSKIMCWVALDRGSKLAGAGREVLRPAVARHRRGDQGRHPHPRRRRPRRADPAVRRRRAGRLTAAGRADPVPAARRPADPGDGLAIAEELTEDGLVLRASETDDGLSGEEGRFTICSFWLVSALVEIGEFHRARHLCERLLGFASPLPLRRGDRAAHRPSPGQLPAGVHPPGADQRRGA
jgi:hypothetical protein